MATKPEKKTVDDDGEIVEGERFQEQCYLMDFFSIFMKNNESHNYENFTQLKANPAATFIGKLLGVGAQKLMDIRPAELSYLQPRIRIYKVDYTGQKEKDLELRFDDKNPVGHRIEDLNKSRIQLGGGAGLKSFEWEDLGTNPGDSGKAFKAVLQMHFQNPRDFFLNRSTDKDREVSFADLVRVPPKKYQKHVRFGKVHNEKHFRIKVQVGWQVPRDNIVFLRREGLRDAIANSVVTMFLGLTKHDLQYQENGTLDVTAEYQGAIETKLLSPETDVLYTGTAIDKQIQNLVSQLDTARGSLKQNIEDTEKRNVREDAKSFRQKVQEFDAFTFIGDAVAASPEDILTERITTLENQRAEFIKENRGLAYKRLLTSLEDQNRIFYVDLTTQELKLFVQSRADKKRFSNEQATKRFNARLKDARENFKKTRIETGGEIIGKGLKEGLDSTIGASINREETPDNRQLTRAKDKKDSGSHRVNFIYFGDLVNAALGIVYGRGQNLTERPENKDLRFLMGPIEILDALTGEVRSMSLADVPISLELFQAWFLKRVIRPAREKYFLRDFLRDICSQLIIKAISPECLGPISKSMRSRISFSVFSLPGEEPIEVGTRIFLKEVVNKPGFRSSPGVGKMKHYFLMYVSGFQPNSREGSFKTDADEGIYHFNVGADRGLLKTIKFDRADIQYLPEARIANAEDVSKGDALLSEPYNSKIILWGNSIFKPGMLCYVNPNSLGMGTSVVAENERLPIGGYYSIIQVSNRIQPGLFETEMKLNWVAFRNQKKKPATQDARPPNEVSITDKMAPI